MKKRVPVICSGKKNGETCVQADEDAIFFARDRGGERNFCLVTFSLPGLRSSFVKEDRIALETFLTIWTGETRFSNVTLFRIGPGVRATMKIERWQFWHFVKRSSG